MGALVLFVFSLGARLRVRIHTKEGTSYVTDTSLHVSTTMNFRRQVIIQFFFIQDLKSIKNVKIVGMACQTVCKQVRDNACMRAKVDILAKPIPTSVLYNSWTVHGGLSETYH